jgi:hypothetical protein
MRDDVAFAQPSLECWRASQHLYNENALFETEPFTQVFCKRK